MKRITQRNSNGQAYVPMTIVQLAFEDPAEKAVRRLALIEDALGDEYDLRELAKVMPALRATTESRAGVIATGIKCPFCGADYIMRGAMHEAGVVGASKCFVVCGVCFARGPEKQTWPEAEAAWEGRSYENND